MANPIAVPGTNVPSGAAVSPGGAQGPTTVSANANNKATLGSDSLLLVQGTAAGVAATTHAQTVSGDDPQLTNARTPTAHHTTHEHGGTDAVSITYSDLLSIPATFAPAPHEASHVTGSDQIPLASSSAKGLMNQTSGNTTDFIDGTNNSQPLQPVIWSARLRSFNAVGAGNPTFEVDQRNCGTASALSPTAAPFIMDRWWPTMPASPGTARVTAQQTAGNIVLPGTNFFVTSKFLRLTLTAQQTTLLAADSLYIGQVVEGPTLRELLGDVHSFSLLVRSSVANLKFSVSLSDASPTQTRCLAKLCTLGAANTFTLIQLPNLPVWSAGGTFPVTPGSNGYIIQIGLAGGTSTIVAANDTWQTTTTAFIATGISNFAASAVNSTFDIAFVQHEPGPLCSTLIDCPFTANLTACQRYFTKSYPYSTKPGTASVNAGLLSFFQGAAQSPSLPIPFKQTLAQAPTVTGYAYDGTINSVRDATAAANKAITSSSFPGDSGFSGFTITSPNAAAWQCQFHYTADTGW